MGRCYLVNKMSNKEKSDTSKQASSAFEGFEDTESLGEDDIYIIDILNKLDRSKRNNNALARRRYERLQEDRQLKAMLGDDYT